MNEMMGQPLNKREENRCAFQLCVFSTGFGCSCGIAPPEIAEQVGARRQDAGQLFALNDKLLKD